MIIFLNIIDIIVTAGAMRKDTAGTGRSTIIQPTTKVIAVTKPKMLAYTLLTEIGYRTRYVDKHLGRHIDII